jgi:hypothetical protein
MVLLASVVGISAAIDWLIADANSILFACGRDKGWREENNPSWR